MDCCERQEPLQAGQAPGATSHWPDLCQNKAGLLDVLGPTLWQRVVLSQGPAVATFKQPFVCEVAKVDAALRGFGLGAEGSGF